MKQIRHHLYVASILLVALWSGLGHTLFTTITDMRFNALPRAASADFVLVAIDAPSIEKVGVWPWPRRLHAKLIDKLLAAGVSDIAFDIDFSSSSTPTDDRLFAQSLARAGGSVILPAFKQYSKGELGSKRLHISLPLKPFRKHAWPATVNIQTEPNGLARRYSFGEIMKNEFYPSVGALLAGVYEQNIKNFELDFSISPKTVPIISYIDIVNGSVPAENLKGKKIIVGGTAAELGDRFYVPNLGTISGPMLQILGAETIVQKRMLQATGPVVSLVGLALLVLLFYIIYSRTNIGGRIALLAGFAALAEIAALVAQKYLPVIVDTSFLLIAVATYIIATTLNEIGFRKILAKIAQQKFHMIAQSLGDGVVCTDEQGLITFWNPGAELIFNYSADEVIGRPIELLHTPVSELGDGASTLLETLLNKDIDRPNGQVIEFVGVRKNGETFPLEACFSSWPGNGGINHGATMRDISVRQREEQRIRYLAEHDSLTALANRNSFNEALNDAIECSQNIQSEVALLLVDLDNFKEINDTLGHQCGDEVLREIANNFRRWVPDNMVARMGGDEFSILLEGKNIAKTAAEVAAELANQLSSTPLLINEKKLFTAASIGIAVYPHDGENSIDLLANADLALYRAKETQLGGYVFYHESIRQKMADRLALEAELKRAFENEEFELFYQPQVDLKKGKLVGVEALIRWHHPERGLVSPGEFMPVLNDGELSSPVSYWVLETAVRQARLWEREGHNIRMGVNLTSSQFDSHELPERVSAILRETKLSPSLLELEVTEDILIEDDELAVDILQSIHDMDVSIAFDDFGTGYASLTYLKRFPLDRLKIDYSFVRDMTSDKDDAAIVRTIIGLGELMGLSVIAEGIEDPETIELLQELNCAEGQGYYFGRPMPSAELQKLLAPVDKMIDLIGDKTLEPVVAA